MEALKTSGDTLFILRRDDGVVLASEPYDDAPDWEDVPDRHLVEVTFHGHRVGAGVYLVEHRPSALAGLLQGGRRKAAQADGPCPSVASNRPR